MIWMDVVCDEIIYECHQEKFLGFYRVTYLVANLGWVNPTQVRHQMCHPVQYLEIRLELLNVLKLPWLE